MSRHLDDWLERYIQLNKNHEAPTLYHLWSGITAITSVLKRKCYSNWGSLGYVYPNLYIALVGPPGGRKGAAMKIAKGMLQQLEIQLGADSLGSTQALYKEIMTSEDSYLEHNGLPKMHKSLSVWSEEFQVFLSDRDPTLIAGLTDLFDCADVWRYTTLKRGSEDVSNCWLTIIGAITPSLLQSKLSQDAVGGGLISRIIFVVGYGAIKRVALPFYTEEEKILKKHLIEDLQQISNFSGPFILKNDFLRVYAQWYEQTGGISKIDSEKFQGYNGRRPLHIKKLCMIISAAESDSMEIHEHHFKKALAIFELTEVEMPNAFHGLGMANTANLMAKILSFIEGRNKITWKELLDRFYLDIENMDVLRKFMDMAEQRGLVTKGVGLDDVTYTVIAKKKEKKNSNDLTNTIYRHLI